MAPHTHGAVAVACYGLADSVSVLVGLRLLTGVGEAFFFVGAVTAMSDLAPEERGEALSLFSGSLHTPDSRSARLVGEAVTGSLGFDATWLWPRPVRARSRHPRRCRSAIPGRTCRCWPSPRPPG